MTSWILGLTGLSGMLGLLVLAYIGGPIVPMVSKVAEAILTPIATVLGGAFQSLFQLEVDGAVNVLKTGQNILFVVTCMAMTHWYAVHTTWAEVHSGYSLLSKTAPAKAVVKHRR